MTIVSSTIDNIKNWRNDYLSSLPEFQELFIEIMIKDSNCYLLQIDGNQIGYSILNSDGVLIEFFVMGKYVPSSYLFFSQLLNDLSVTEIYCKSFDSLLLSNCLLSSFSYSAIGVLYRDYVEALIRKDPEIAMQKADNSSIRFLLGQDDSIKELFETEQELTEFINNQNVFEFYKNDEFIGCGMVLRTHDDWNFCDLGVWVKPSRRGHDFGSQIILSLRAFAIKNSLKPSCGCAIDNIASQKTIEKSGFVSKHKMISFRTVS
jgi:RimJ/RimL family protein N-acetyltransferase